MTKFSSLDTFAGIVFLYSYNKSEFLWWEIVEVIIIIIVIIIWRLLTTGFTG